MTAGNITTLVGVLTLIIGVITFMVTEIDKRRRAVNALLRDWQGDTIAYIVDESGSTGLEFSEIKAKYITASNQHKEGRIPTYMLQDEEIRRTLFDLQSKGVLYRMDNGNYICRRKDAPEKMENQMKKFSDDMMNNLNSIMRDVQERNELNQKQITSQMTERLERFANYMQEMRSEQLSYEQSEKTHRDIQRAALEIAGRDPNRYNADQIAIDVMDRTKADRVVVMIQIISLLQNGILTQGADGKVSIRLYTLPEPVLR